jgi:ribonuclease P/MRP protein subunit POP5
MKKLLSSLRDKKRYIAFEVESESRLNKTQVVKSVNSGCREFLGDYLCGKSGVRAVEEFFSGTGGVMRVKSGYVDYVKTSLALIKKVEGKRVMFKNTKVSGNLSKVKGGQ